MKAKDADLFDTLEDQIKAMYGEIGLLSKKKPDGPLSKFKLKFINDILNKVNQLVGSEYMPLDDFATFDEDDLPSASDVVFILSQYLESMNKFRSNHTFYDDQTFTQYWRLPGGTLRATRRPR